ncbi:general secretion pathway protein G [Desulfosudis oleivorans Hxd3]|uniref:Type II secretion system core protein G n=1 Tax=Desulfosudis oleivorans (strain DSM 6200 / JCM 39069 / Hxd3) TaxID=96561 RepID=A8ZWY6_DESOH|nr:type II secretion system major pseudopilin GspG [Desulfosudis oleivorans]ABW66842.1 general secretion pathway protein G [Desulfosudis oleivorans Hxd3]
MYSNQRSSVQKKNFSPGFTLIELLVVLVILGIIGVTVAPRILGKPDEAKKIKAATTIEAISTALKLYKLDNGAYPTTSQGLEALVRKPESGNTDNWQEGGYLEKGKVPRDPWGNPFVYMCPGVHGDFDIISYGADGAPGGEGKYADIKSWEIE